MISTSIAARRIGAAGSLMALAVITASQRQPTFEAARNFCRILQTVTPDAGPVWAFFLPLKN